MLRREQKIRNIVLFTLFSILFIGVGYAVISSHLNINGSLVLNKITWDVHFENFQEAIDNTVKATTHTISTDGTTLTYNVKLNKPGDKYSFTVDVVNSGNLDAMIQSLGNSGLSDAQEQVMDYSVKYIDGNSPKEKDALSTDDSETFLVTISAKADITNSQLTSTDTNLNLKFNLTYAQADGTSVSRPNKIYNIVKKKAVLDNIKSDFVSSTTGINFSQISSDTNGKGVYILSSTKDDKKPIYYYRGAVSDNNVLFANYCWKIVRTTDTGGIKLIYNGNPTDGKCNNTGVASQITLNSFNSNYNAIAYVGYTYGDVYEYKTIASPNGTFASLATYSEGRYTLNTTSQTLDNTHHYSCGDTSSSCQTIRYYFGYYNNQYYYIELKNGKLMNEELLNEMFSNNYTDSHGIKSYIENDWYINNMINFTGKIEDTIYCNDRTIYKKAGWDPDGGDLNSFLMFTPTNRLSFGLPTINCSRTEDKFTVSSSIGNGNLKYPVGLLTIDEAILAGATGRNNESYYLYTGEVYWTMSPYDYNFYYAGNYDIYSTGYGNVNSVGNSYGVRPVISLKTGNTIKSGNGTSDSPYIIN